MLVVSACLNVDGVVKSHPPILKWLIGFLEPYCGVTLRTLEDPNTWLPLLGQAEMTANSRA